MQQNTVKTTIVYGEDGDRELSVTSSPITNAVDISLKKCGEQPQTLKMSGEDTIQLWNALKAVAVGIDAELLADLADDDDEFGLGNIELQEGDDNG